MQISPKTIRMTAVSLMAVILFSIVVFARDDWLMYGGSDGFSGQSYNNFLFMGSNSPTGSTNFSSFLITQGSTFTPLIDDVNNDHEQDIIQYDGQTIFVYNSQGNYQDSYDLPTGQGFYGNGCIFNYDANYLNEIAVMSKSGTGGSVVYYMNIFNFDDNLKLYSVKNFTLNSYPAILSNLFCGDGYRQWKFYSPMYNTSAGKYANILEYDLETETIKIYSNGDSAYNTMSMLTSYGKHKNSAGSMTIDSYPSIFFVMRLAGSSIYRLAGFNTESNTWYSAVTIGDTGDDTDNVEVIVANLGSPSSSRELIISNNGGTGIGLVATSVYDYNLNLKFSYDSQQSVVNTTAPTVCDINHDGLNELVDIGFKPQKVVAFGFDGEVILNSSMYPSFGYASRTDMYITCADFILNNSYNEIITYEGIYEYDGVSWNLSNDLDISSTDGQIIPVRLRNILTDVDNLIFWDNVSMNIFISSAVTDCGNGICEIGENQFSCYADCYTGETGNQVPQFSILNGYTCLNDSYCLSGICDLISNTCIGKSQGSECTLDSECTSGVCENFICTQVDMKDNIEDWFTRFGFRSALSKILLALVIIVAFTLGAGSTGYGTGGKFGGALGGFVGFVASLFVTILVFGWLGIWIVFMMVLFVTVGMVFFLKFGSGGG